MANERWIIMPEIPEIETVRCLLEQRVTDKLIRKVDIFRSKAINISPEKFVEHLVNQTITSVRRRAKVLIISLSNDTSVLVHFMLEGFARFFTPQQEPEGKPSLQITFKSGERLGFFKITLGYVHWVQTQDFAEMSELADLGPEPLSSDFTLQQFTDLLTKRKGMIKPLLMDQNFIAGIGNVYSNEVLFCSGILPERKVPTLSSQDISKIYGCLREILQRSIRLGGVYEEKFTSDDKLSGGFTPYLQVAYRTGEPCHLCGHEILTKKVGGRNAFFCPNCQS